MTSPGFMGSCTLGRSRGSVPRVVYGRHSVRSTAQPLCTKSPNTFSSCVAKATIGYSPVRAAHPVAVRPVDLSWGVGTRHYGPIQTLGTPNVLGTQGVYEYYAIA